ncbi:MULTISPECIES: hypothetical protein [Bacillus cereus group]|uniref:Uncharacterized protein n=1 Tax=Bacillus thuringiensis TaxID=1428 RepID=A0A9X7FXW8_BACTU|nr:MULTISPECIES: hypothetical protein [Bacillus cereus group]PFT50753.1 hypothetical protein COK72_01760 [Bacillus thuringiensis]PFY22790.1 hypothetical protein COL44_18080 [Bacillus toyonensis]
MKKFIKKMVGIGIIGAILGLGFLSMDLEIISNAKAEEKTTVARSTHDTNKDFIFMQEFKYNGEKTEDGYYKLDNIHDDTDFVYANAEEMDYHIPMVGQNVIVQFNHDDIEIVYVQNMSTVQNTYIVTDANEKGINDFNDDEYIFLVNEFNPNDTMVLENNGTYKLGDKINVAMNLWNTTDRIVDIQKVEKGDYDKDFRENDLNDENRNKDGYVQAEDGSWVKSDFWN